MKKLLLTCSLGLTCFASNLNAQVIDSTFAINGLLPFFHSSAPQSTYIGTNTNSNGNKGKGNASAIQPDGKIVTVLNLGYSNNNLMMCVYRYLPDGMPDFTFGQDGVARLFCGTNSSGHDVVIQSDGKIVLVGESEYCINGVCGAKQFIMMRLHPDGSLDTSFGVNGHLTTDVVYGTTGTYAIPKCVSLLPDGKFLVGGKGPSGRPSVVRLTANGMPDPSYGQNGVYVLSHVPRTQFVDMQVNDNGETYALYMRDTYDATQGGFHPENHSDFGIFKVSNTGTLDLTFGTNGLTERDLEVSEDPMSLLLTSTNKLIVAGFNISTHKWFESGQNSGYGKLNRGFAASFLINGDIDNSMPNGYNTYHFAADSATFIHKIIEYTPNEYMLCGFTIEAPNEGGYRRKGLVMSITPDLQLNTDFNQTGHIIYTHAVPSTSIGQATVSYLNDIDITSDQKLIFTGERNATSGLAQTGIYMFRLKRTAEQGLTIEEQPNSLVAAIYPNPVVDKQFSVEVDEQSDLRVFSIEGKLVYEGQLEKGVNAISLPNEVIGMAIATIISEKGRTYTQKLTIY